MMSVSCSWCGYGNRPASRYCGDCGRSLTFTAVCAACAAANPPGARFCDACGAGMAGAQAGAALTGPAPQTAVALTGGAPQLVGTAPVPALAGHGVTNGQHVVHAAPSQSSGLPAAALPAPPAGGVARLSNAVTRRLAGTGLLTAASAALATVVILSLLLRLASLGGTPSNVTADEADNLQTVYHIQAGTGPGFFGLDWKPSPAMSMYLVTGFLNLFGNSIFAMRLPSAVLSVVAILVFYHVVRPTVSRPAAIAATVLLSTSLWYLHFSRSGWENIHIGLYGLLALLCLTMALRGRSLLLFAASGFFAAAGLYGYISGSVIILGLIATLPVGLFLYRKRLGRVAAGYALLLAVCSVLYYPQMQESFDEWEHFTNRQRAVSIMGQQDGYMGDVGLPSIVASQVVRNVKGFILMDSGVHGVGLNARYIAPGRGALDLGTAIIFWVGMIVSFRRLRETAIWWIMFLFMVLPIQVLSTGTPDLARGVGSAPFFFLFVALGLDWVFKLMQAKAIQDFRPLMQAGVAISLALIVLCNVTGYFGWVNSEASRGARQPAVENAEFAIWQSLQMQDAEAGRFGFNVNQWHEMRQQYIR
ncbi:MAG: hypothetical protein FJ319_04775 [SAR202 cluster bacterium]|nr:hypothetical protein [SAR202 cluster bacterium]